MIDCITIWDWSRSYVLPEHVCCNIPRSGSVGMYGAHNWARGLLVELCRYLPADPVALHYTCVELDARHGVQTVTASVTRHDGRPLQVQVRLHGHYDGRGDHEDRDDDWALSIDGVAFPAESRRYPPSLPFQGHLVRYLTWTAAPVGRG